MWSPEEFRQIQLRVQAGTATLDDLRRLCAEAERLRNIRRRSAWMSSEKCCPRCGGPVEPDDIWGGWRCRGAACRREESEETERLAAVETAICVACGRWCGMFAEPGGDGCERQEELRQKAGAAWAS